MVSLHGRLGAEGVKTVTSRWVDTDKGDADPPNYRSIGRARDQEGDEEIRCSPLQLDSSVECHLWKV